ncbi:MAG: FtsQ-type POTRA domain-containing protein [Firmicutes bacterium]|nr:FtsQ-type POTRA domain-containing protein [Bacillota bacterium]
MAKILKIQGLGDESNRSFPLGILIGAGIVVLLIILLNSPLFSLRTFEVEGNERVSDEKIMKDLELSYGTNLFRYFLKHLGKSDEITVDSRLSTVDVYFRWPSKVVVEVEESETIGYVYFQGSYLCIDQKGQVADSTRDPDDDLPVIVGLNVGDFSIGQPLGTSDGERYEAVMTIGANLRKYELTRTVKEINVRNLDDILITTDRLMAHCGSMSDMGRKVNIIAELSKNPDVPEGILHMENLNEQIYIETQVEGGDPVGE